MSQEILLPLVIALLSLDDTHFFQGNFGRPLIGGIIIGFLCGNIALGLLIGAMMQPLWLASIPAGGTYFPEGGIATMYSVFMASGLIEKQIPMDNFLFPLILFAVLLGGLGGLFSVANRHFNTWLFNLHEKKGRIRPANRYIMLGVLIHFSFWGLILNLIRIPSSVSLRYLSSLELLRLPSHWTFLGIISLGLIFLIRENELKNHWLESSMAMVLGGLTAWFLI
jgi:mannose/fructose/N-acetylgalactosamine-specific phosphotransferase system component IIC